MSRLTLLLTLLVAMACAAESPSNAFVVLGSAGGPSAEVDRSQPANALLVGDDVYLVDAGDGTAGQLAKAGIRLTDVDAMFLGHLHFDHTGGVLAVLGLRMQLNARTTLRIYGPPGTEEFIDGLVVAMEPAMRAAYGMPGQTWEPLVEVHELVDGSVVGLPGVKVTVAENTHYAIPESSGMSEKAKGISFRFDLDDRSIVYTGDTGPSKAVEELARDADLLVIEMMDIDAVIANVRRMVPDIPDRAYAGLEWHLRAHHVLPEQVGAIARRAEVGSVVITHMSPNIRSDEMAARYLDEVAKEYDGSVRLADDLDRF